jgi:hypothetical protein
MAMVRHRRLCDEIARAVSFADSQRFRWVTVVHAYAPFVAVTLVAYLVAGDAPFGDELPDRLFAAVWPVVVVHVCLLLFLAGATGIPSYFFHPRGLSVDLQNRAIALSYYTCGPLAIMCVPVAAGIPAVLLGWDSNLGVGLGLFGWIFPGAQFAVWYFDLCHLAGRLIPHDRTRGVLVAIFVPLLWFALASLLLVLIPASILTIAVFVLGTG